MITTPKTSLSSMSHSRFLALVIDHDSDSRLALCGLLESEDCYVIDMENSTAAISAFHELKPDIILLNAVLPDINSFDLCAQIHAMPHDPATPVLMMIDNDDEALIDRALTAGAADYVTKPIRPRVLRQRIRRLLHAHQTAVAVIRAKKEWEAAFDAVSDMIILTDLDGKIIRCNLATTQRLKTNYQDLIGDDLGNVFLQARAKKLGLAFGQALEMQLPALPGWFEVRMFPGQVQGRPHAIVYVFKDITERKRVEAALAESEKRLRTIIETMPIPVLISSVSDGKILFANAPLGKAFGLAREELVGRQSPDFYVNPEDRKRLLEKLHNDCILRSYELAVKRADETPFWVLVDGQFVTFGGQEALLTAFYDVTERRRVEENLRTSEARYRTLFEDSPVALWEEDFSDVKAFFDHLKVDKGIADFRAYFETHPEAVTECAEKVKVKDVNKAAMKMLGAEEKEQLLVGLSSIFSFESSDSFREELIHIAEGCENYTFEGVNRALNGTNRYVRVLWSVWPGYEDTLSNVTVSVIDLTERKQAEEMLQETEERLRLIVETIPVPIVISSEMDGKIFFANDAMSELIGLPLQELLAGYTSDLYFDASQRKHLLKTLRNNGQLHNYELVLKKADQTPFWVLISMQPLSFANQPALFAALYDVTERKQAEMALMESEQRFRQLFSASPDAIVVIDPSHPVDWTIIDCNEAACQMNGYTREELIGQSIDLLNGTMGSAPERAAYLAHLQSNGILHMEASHRHKDGHFFPVEISTTLFRFNGRELVLGIDRDITERKQAEEALRLSEERFQLVTLATNDAVWDLNLETGERWWNAGLRSLFGYGPNQVTNDQDWWRSQIHPDDRSKVLQSFEKALSDKSKFWSKEYRYGKADQTYAYVFDRGYIMLDEQSVPVRVIGAMMDISDRKQSEEALRKREQQLEEAQQIAHLGSWEWDATSDTAVWSKELYRLYGYDPHAVPPQFSTFIEAIHPDDRQQILQNELKYSGPLQYDYRITVNGDVRWLHARAEITTDSEGKPLHMRGVTQDITERKHMEEALIKSEEFFSKAFHASPAPMAITRVNDGVFIDVNSSWERLLKYKRDTLIGHSLQDFNIIVNPEDRSKLIQRIREQGKVDDYEIKVRNQSGEELNLLQSAQIVEIESQECLLSTFYDITQLQQLHQAMLASQKLADLGTLAAGVAHEMNSPLQVITGVSQSLLRKATNGVLDSEQLKYNLDVIHRNGWRCAEIVRSLHTYARASGGAKQPADLNGLIHDCLLLIEHQLKSWAGIIVVTELAPDLPLLTCDHNQITQVLINLLTNARDAMPQGGDITISTAHDSGTDELILSVRDSGSGIPSSVLTKIFDPFFTTKALGQGSGLGLSISAGIIRAHGGTIEVDTTAERGTTFTMRFPTRHVSLPASDSTNIAGRFDEVTATPPTNQFGSTPQETSHA